MWVDIARGIVASANALTTGDLAGHAVMPSNTARIARAGVAETKGITRSWAVAVFIAGIVAAPRCAEANASGYAAEAQGLWLLVCCVPVVHRLVHGQPPLCGIDCTMSPQLLNAYATLLEKRQKCQVVLTRTVAVCLAALRHTKPVPALSYVCCGCPFRVTSLERYGCCQLSSQELLLILT